MNHSFLLEKKVSQYDDLRENIQFAYSNLIDDIVLKGVLTLAFRHF